MDKTALKNFKKIDKLSLKPKENITMSEEDYNFERACEIIFNM